jgi:hypothetical protein
MKQYQDEAISGIIFFTFLLLFCFSGYLGLNYLDQKSVYENKIYFNHR